MPTTIRTTERRPQQGSPSPAPLLVVLHGYGSNEHDLMAVAQYVDPRYHIVSARGILDVGYGYAWYRLAGTPGNLHPDATSRANGLDTLQKFVAQLPEQLGTDPRHTYLLGFSQGAIMSLAVALTIPDKVAGVIAASGYLDTEMVGEVDPQRLKDLDVLLLHGSADDVVPVEGSRRAYAYLETTPAHVVYHEYPIGHSIHPDAIAATQQWLQERIAGAS